MPTNDARQTLQDMINSGLYQGQELTELQKQLAELPLDLREPEPTETKPVTTVEDLNHEQIMAQRRRETEASKLANEELARTAETHQANNPLSRLDYLNKK